MDRLQYPSSGPCGQTRVRVSNLVCTNKAAKIVAIGFQRACASASGGQLCAFVVRHGFSERCYCYCYKSKGLDFSFHLDRLEFSPHLDHFKGENEHIPGLDIFSNSHRVPRSSRPFN